MARGLNLSRIKEEGRLYYVVKTKGLISCAATVQPLFLHVQKAGFLKMQLILLVPFNTKAIIFCIENLVKNLFLHSISQYILNAKNLAPPFLSIFFWNKIDDFKNQCSLVFMPVQLTIVVEKIKRV